MEQNTNIPKPEEKTSVIETPAALPWVKWHTKTLTSPKWRALPMEKRGVFTHLILLAGTGKTRGLIEATDGEIADLIGCQEGLVTEVIDLLSKPPFRSIKRLSRAIRLVNWDIYNPPLNFDPTYQKPRKSRKTAASLAIATAIGREEKSREDKKRVEESSLGPREKEVWDALADVPGYPRDLAKDAPLLTGVVRDYAILDLVAQMRRWAAYKSDKPFGPKSSPRGQLRSWLDIALRDAVRNGVTVAAPVAQAVPGRVMRPETEEDRMNRLVAMTKTPEGREELDYRRGVNRFQAEHGKLPMYPDVVAMDTALASGRQN